MTAPAAVSDATFDAEVLGAEVPVLVDFWAQWCGPCRLVAPVVHELAEEYAGRMKFVSVDADDNPATMARYGIVSIPTLNFYAGGELVRSVVGARPKQAIREDIEAVLGRPGSV